MTDESRVTVTREDFELLLEGAPAHRHLARRDQFASIALSCCVGVIGLLGTIDTAAPRPNWWALGFMVILLAATLGAAAIAYFAHQDAGSRAEGAAYAQCVRRIEEQLG